MNEEKVIRDPVNPWRAEPVPRGSFWLFAFGVIWPGFVFFIFGLSGVAVPGTQEPGAFAAMMWLLGGAPLVVMIPVMLFAWGALSQFFADDGGTGAAPWVRWGLRSGAVSSLVYSVALLVGVPMVMALFILVALGFFGGWLGWRILHGSWSLSPKARDWNTRALLAVPWIALLFCGYALLSGGTMRGEGLVLLLFGLPLILLFVLSPMVMCVIFVTAIIRVRLDGSETPPRSAAAIGWLAATGTTVSWSTAILLAIKDHAAAPLPEPQGCYVATAAAQGHSTVVRSWPRSDAHGAMRVNGQLQVLKAGELALRVTFPRIHRRIRAAYDRHGPHWAARISTPWRADMAYIGLIPIALTVVVLLACAAPGTLAASRGLYRMSDRG